MKVCCRAEVGTASSSLVLASFCVPIAPGSVRVITTSITNNQKFRTFSNIYKSMPWVGHLKSHDINDGDTLFIAMQARVTRHIERLCIVLRLTGYRPSELLLMMLACTKHRKV